MKLLKQNSFRQNSEERRLLEEHLLHLQFLFSDIKENVNLAVNFYRRMFLTQEREEVVNNLFALNVCPRIMELMQWNDCPEIQLQSCFILLECTTSSMTQVDYLLSCDLVTVLCTVLVEQRCIPLVVANIVSILGSIGETIQASSSTSQWISVFQIIKDNHIFPFLLLGFLRRDLTTSTLREMLWKVCLIYRPPLSSGFMPSERLELSYLCKLLQEISREYSSDILGSDFVLSRIIESLPRIKDKSLLSLFLGIIGSCLAFNRIDHAAAQQQLCLKVKKVANALPRERIIDSQFIDRLLQLFCRSSGKLKRTSYEVVVRVCLDSDLIADNHLSLLESFSDDDFRPSNLALLQFVLLFLAGVKNLALYQKCLRTFISHKLI